MYLNIDLMSPVAIRELVEHNIEYRLPSGDFVFTFKAEDDNQKDYAATCIINGDWLVLDKDYSSVANTRSFDFRFAESDEIHHWDCIKRCVTWEGGYINDIKAGIVQANLDAGLWKILPEAVTEYEFFVARDADNEERSFFRLTREGDEVIVECHKFSSVVRYPVEKAEELFASGEWVRVDLDVLSGRNDWTYNDGDWVDCRGDDWAIKNIASGGVMPVTMSKQLHGEICQAALEPKPKYRFFVVESLRSSKVFRYIELSSGRILVEWYNENHGIMDNYVYDADQVEEYFADGTWRRFALSDLMASRGWSYFDGDELVQRAVCGRVECAVEKKIRDGEWMPFMISIELFNKFTKGVK